MSKRNKQAPAAPPLWTEPAWVAPLLLWFPALCVAFLLITRVNDLDIWIHLAVGRWIAAHRALPRAEIFSYTAAGVPWIPHEWLSELLFFGVFKFFGLDGIVLLKAALVSALVLCAALQADSRRLAALAGAGPVLVLAVCAARSSLLERPQLFTYLLTAGYLLILKKSERRPRLLWLLPPLQAAWVNLHGAACLTGLALIGCWWLGSWNPLGPAPAPGLRRRLGLTGAACVAAMLLNPFGWRVFGELFRAADPRYASLIREWAPLTFDAASAPIWLPLVALEIVSAGAWLLNRERRVAEALVWAAFLILSFRAFRFATEAALVFGQLFAGEWGALSAAWRPRPRRGWAVLAASLAVSAGLAWGFETREFAGFFRPGFGASPDAGPAIAFMEKSSLRGPLFNEYELGGQLLWFAPGRPVFVDGRNLQYGPDLVRDAMHWFEPAVWSRLDARYGFQLALVRNGPSYACAVLDEDPSWRLVYWDDMALLYVRGADNIAAAGGGYRYLQPNRTSFDYLLPSLQDPRSRDAVLEEARRSVAAAPDAADPRLLEAYVLRKLGRLAEAVPVLLDAARRAPDSVDTAYALGLALQQAGRFEEAEPLYRQAAAQAVREGQTAMAADALSNLGAILYRRGDRDGAAALWRRALGLDPNNVVARHDLAMAGG